VRNKKIIEFCILIFIVYVVIVSISLLVNSQNKAARNKKTIDLPTVADKQPRTEKQKQGPDKEEEPVPGINTSENGVFLQ